MRSRHLKSIDLLGIVQLGRIEWALRTFSDSPCVFKTAIADRVLCLGLHRIFLEFPSIELPNSRHQILQRKERPVLGRSMTIASLTSTLGR